VEKGAVMGHEFMGIVEELGSAVKAVRAGDRVVIITHTLPLKDTLHGYAIFDRKEDRAINVMLEP
jgi:threonine dehydrogenase-like Zn-dependent dehydrogenase